MKLTSHRTAVKIDEEIGSGSFSKGEVVWLKSNPSWSPTGPFYVVDTKVSKDIFEKDKDVLLVGLVNEREKANGDKPTYHESSSVLKGPNKES